MLNLESRIRALENRRPDDDPGTHVPDEEVAEGAEVHLGVAPGVLERARAAGVDIFTQCRAESARFRELDDHNNHYRDKDGRLCGLVIVTDHARTGEHAHA